MASITPEEFRTRFPEFADETEYPDELIQGYITDTECMMAEGPWGCAFQRAQACLVAHYLVLHKWTSNSDPLSSIGKGTVKSSESEGDVSVTMAVGNAGSMQGGVPADDLYMVTLYGRMYVQLRDTTLVGIAVTGPGSSMAGRARAGLPGTVGSYGH